MVNLIFVANLVKIQQNNNTPTNTHYYQLRENEIKRKRIKVNWENNRTLKKMKTNILSHSFSQSSHKPTNNLT